MLFSSVAKGYFVELSEHAVLLARTSAPLPPFAVEELKECAPGDGEALRQAVTQLQPKKSPSGYLSATVGLYPQTRFLRRHSLELKRVKEAGYLEEICSQQFRVEPQKYTVAVLNADNGADYDTSKSTQKDVLFCGLPVEDIHAQQQGLLDSRVYPDRLELTSVAVLGAIADYLAFNKSKTPTLILEIDAQTTQSFIVTASGVEASRPITQGLDSMVPLVQKELGLKDEESARKLFYSNTFDFTGMGPLLTKRLLKELQSSIGFYEVQTGQSVGQMLTTQIAPKLKWLDTAIASALGISTVKLDPVPWLKSRGVIVPDKLAAQAQELRWFGLLALMARYDLVHATPAEEKS